MFRHFFARNVCLYKGLVWFCFTKVWTKKPNLGYKTVMFFHRVTERIFFHKALTTTSSFLHEKWGNVMKEWNMHANIRAFFSRLRNARGIPTCICPGWWKTWINWLIYDTLKTAVPTYKIVLIFVFIYLWTQNIGKEPKYVFVVYI